MTSLTDLAKKIDQVDSEIKDVGQSYMFKKKFMDYPKILEGEQLGTKNDPLDPSSQKIDQVDSKTKDMGQSYMFKKKYINQP